MNFDSALVLYKNHIIEDYRVFKIPNRFTTDISDPNFQAESSFRDELYRKFADSYEERWGSKFLKIIVNDSVHSFIVLVDTGKFRRGEILKAASYKAPALNFSRGDILSPESYESGSVTWTGAH